MKYYGNIGFAEVAEVSPGKWVEQITERPYYGDVVRRSIRTDNSGYVNDDINNSMDLSIISDSYAHSNIAQMRYAVIDGVKWKIYNVDPTNPPRLTLSIGGQYHDAL